MGFIRGRELLIIVVIVASFPGASYAQAERYQPGAAAAGAGKQTSPPVGYGNNGGVRFDPRIRQPPDDHGDGNGVGLGIGIAAIFAIGTGIAIASERHQAENIDEANLLANGPQIDDLQQDGSVAVHGFVQAGWPFVIDFEPQPGTQTYVSIETKNHKAIVLPLDKEGRGGRRVLNNVIIPRSLGADRPTPAVIIVYSNFVGNEASERQQASSGGTPSPPNASFILYGIGAGPTAFGSVTIENLEFTQQRRGVGSGFAAYRYYAEVGFNRVVPEVLRFTSTGSTIRVSRIRQLPSGSAMAGVAGPAGWDGLDDRGQKETGLTRLQVRGWQNQVYDKSWVGAVSPQAIIVE